MDIFSTDLLSNKNNHLLSIPGNMLIPLNVVFSFLNLHNNPVRVFTIISLLYKEPKAYWDYTFKVTVS